MGKIVVIGGGEIGRPGYPVETTKIDKEIIKLTNKSKPKLLFIPTASSDSELYVNCVNKHFGKRLGCKVDALYLLNKKKENIADKILNSDIIYVGGGNTLKMMKRWHLLGVDKLLKKAYKKNIVLSGLSAGGICWFEYGHSDSMSFYNPNSWKYIRVKGLGLIKGIHCPHFDSATKQKKRRKEFMEFMKKYSDIGIAIDNCCAIEFVDKKYKVISAKNNANAYKIYKKNNKIKAELIKKEKEYKSIKELYKK